MCRKCGETKTVNRDRKEVYKMMRNGEVSVMVPGGIDACPDCAAKAEAEYQVNVQSNAYLDAPLIEDRLKQLKRQILMMEMDDTVGHSASGPYFSQLCALKTELSDLQKVGGK